MHKGACLTENQRRAAALIAAGNRQVAVAQALGVTPKTISQWRRRDDFVAEIALQSREITASVKDVAANVIRELLQSDRDGIRLRAAQDVLTRAERAEAREVQTGGVTVNFLYMPEPGTPEA